MIDNPNIFTPGPKPNTLRCADGIVLTPTEKRGFLPPAMQR